MADNWTPVHFGRKTFEEDLKPKRKVVVSWIRERYRYQKLAERCEPIAVVMTKDHWGWSFLWWVGFVLTLSILALAIGRLEFLWDFATTVITRQGYPRKWESLSNRVIVHECRHTTQSTWFGWIFFPVAWINRRLRAWLGAPGFALVYFILPIPIGLAAGRFYLELDADRASWRRGLREGWMSSEDVLESAKKRAVTVSSRAYGWAWPKKWAKGSYDRAATAEVALAGRG